MARHTRRLILWTAGGLLSLALLAVLGFVLVVWGIDPDVFRGRIERAASEALGRRVELTGTLRWRPGLHLQVESLGGRIANAEGFGPLPLASWDSLRLGVALRPLRDRHLVIDRIEVQGLRLELVRHAEGGNWTLPRAAAGSQADGLTVAIGRVALRDAAITWNDAVNGQVWSATSMDMQAQLPMSFESPALRFTEVTLRATLRGPLLAPSGVAMALTVPRADVLRTETRVSLPAWRLEWNDAVISGDLDAALAPPFPARGRVQVNAPSMRRLMQSVAIAAPATRDAGVFGALRLDTQWVMGEGGFALKALDARLDATHLEGHVELPTLSPLSLRWALAADQMDVDRYLPPDNAPSTPLQLPLAALKSLDARGVLTIGRASLAGAAARELRIDVE